MFNNFLTNIKNNSLFSKNDFLLVALSGGIDSVVLIHLLHKGGYKFAIAHCNFSLRAKDADEDEKFVIELANKYSVNCFTVRFNTFRYAEENGISVQMAAREMRYKWFDELMKIYGFDYLLTAHHSDDNIETILLHQIRGTGIKGLTGISEKDNQIVRPLLKFSKEEIVRYAQKNQLTYREDVSNYSDKYQRNFLRLNILPLIKKIQPQAEKIFQNNILHFIETNEFIADCIHKISEKSIFSENNVIHIKKNVLRNEKHLHFILQYFLSEFNFNNEQIKDITEHFYRNISGKKFISKTHTLFFDREDIFLIRNNQEVFHNKYTAYNIWDLNLYSDKYCFEFIPNDKMINLKDKQHAFIHADNINFPLIIRHWQEGDRFRLMGTSYNKKLSDIFIDKKVPVYFKDKILLLCNTNDEILWISDLNLVNEKYKIRQDTLKVLKISGR